MVVTCENSSLRSWSSMQMATRHVNPLPPACLPACRAGLPLSSLLLAWPPSQPRQPAGATRCLPTRPLASTLAPTWPAWRS
jgi:hypothetical protein